MRSRGCAGLAVGLAVLLLPLAGRSAPATAPSMPVASGSGPGWWRVSDADSEVWILGAPERMPLNTSFDTGPLTQHLTGANQLILTPPAEDSVSVALKASSQRRTKIPTQPLARRLPPELYARVIAAFPKMEINLASGGGIHYIGDYRAMLDEEPTINTADWLAQGSYQALPLGNVPANKAKAIVAGMKGAKPKILNLPVGATGIRALLNVADVSEELQEVCLQYVLANIEAGSGGAKTRQDGIDAWARGDVVHALKRYSLIYGCPYGPIGTAFWTKVVGDYTKAVTDALAAPGKSVAVFEYDPMLMKGGVLDQLEAKGFKVQYPDEI